MSHNVTIVIGGQYGSEAKGKVCSFLAGEFDVTVRTGSPNSGHTVIHDSKTYRLKQLPSTFVNPNCALCIGAGALINPSILAQEVEETQSYDRLIIDPQAGILEDRHIEQEQDLVKNIGSTGQGCGAALVNRIWRNDFKLARDVLAHDFTIQNVAELANRKIDEGAPVLLEGTQGFGLSLFHGEYPFVTSRDTTPGAMLAECGISPRLVTDIIMVIRTFPIRVAGNSGPLAHEISWDELSKRIGKDVRETTTVTGNTRRIGEFDDSLVKRAITYTRPTQIALQFLNYQFPQDEDVTDWNMLSAEAKKYIMTMEQELRVPITLIGTGADHSAMIDRR